MEFRLDIKGRRNEMGCFYKTQAASRILLIINMFICPWSRCYEPEGQENNAGLNQMESG